MARENVEVRFVAIFQFAFSIFRRAVNQND